MLGLVGLANDPSDEQLGLLPWLRQQLEGNHVEHLNGLVEFNVEFAQVVQPEEQEANDGEDYEDIQQDSAETDKTASLTYYVLLPN